MSIYVPVSNVEENESFGQAINKLMKEYIEPELKNRKQDNFKYAGIEIFKNGKYKVRFDTEVNIIYTLKKKA